MSISAAAGIMASLFGLCGILALTAAVLNWDWFFRSANVRMLTFGLRRPWQRLIYGLCGAAMIYMAYRLTLDAIAMQHP